MPPTKLAHVVYQTNRMPEMRDWYATVLGGHVVYENPQLCFVTYDDEHHRVAFVDFGPLSPRAGAEVELGPKPVEQPGLHHVAFTYGSMGELLDTYARPPGSRHPSVLLREPRAHHVDGLPGPPTATGSSCRSTTSRPPRKGRRGCTRRRSIATRSGSSTIPISKLVEKFQSGVPVSELIIRE